MRKIVFAISTLALALGGCAGKVKKADIDASANPSTEISRLEGAIADGKENQLDVLDHSNFKKAESSLDDAKKDLAKGKKQSKVLDDVAYGDAYLQKATENAEARRAQSPALFQARQKALVAGARKNGMTEERLDKIDGVVEGKVDRLNKLSADEISELQMSYLDLELAAVTARELGDAKAKIDSAKSHNAKRYAPKALKRAELDYATAENRIRANRNMTDSYGDAVARARTSAAILSATLDATKRGAVDEDTASRLVMQDRQITALSSTLEANRITASDQKSALENEIAARNSRLKAQTEKLMKADAAVRLQASIDKARQEFSSNEAEVFQQGDQLVIRLKAMNFPSGRSDLPPSALPLLAKVRDVAAGLNPESIAVEGHTDSTGSQTVNQQLSEARAESVVNYFATNGLGDAELSSSGYGFEKPIASNKTKAGREQNRRVDIIVTPSERAPASIEDQE